MRYTVAIVVQITTEMSSRYGCLVTIVNIWLMQDLAILFLRTQYCLLINSYWILRQLCCCCNNLWMETNNAETRQHTSAKTNNGGATWRCCWKIYSNGKMAAIRTLWIGSTPKFPVYSQNSTLILQGFMKIAWELFVSPCSQDRRQRLHCLWLGRGNKYN